MPSDLPQLDLDAQLCFPLYAASRALTRRYGPLLAATGLTYPQYLSMLALWESPEPLTVGDLGHRLRLDSGTLTPVLKRLEAAGHVTRRRDPADERRVLLSVTEQGRRLREEVAQVPLQLMAGVDLPPSDGEDLRRLLGDLLDELDRAEPTEGPSVS